MLIIFIMRLLLAVWLFFCLPLLALETQPPPLILFTNDGTFYRLDVQTKAVEWHSSLNLKLMSFQMQEVKDINSTYFLPTIDGHFLYIDKKRQVLVQRSEVQHLLHVCFQGHEEENTKYFVYEKFEYFVLNTKNGNVELLQHFIQSKKSLQRKDQIQNDQPNQVILALSQKFLKQLTTGLQVKWSAISSTVNLISIEQFFRQPTVRSEEGPHQAYSFKRAGPKDLKIITDADNDEFELESSSTILSIFSYSYPKQKYISHIIQLQERPKLALQWKGSKNEKINQNTFDRIRRVYRNNGILEQDQSPELSNVDIHNIDFLPINPKLIDSSYGYDQDDSLMFCVNSFRNLMRLKDKDKSISYEQISRLLNNNSRKEMQEYLKDYVPPTIPYSYAGKQEYTKQKEQPVALIFSGAILILILFILYKVGIKKIMNQLSRLDQKNQSKIQELQRKLKENNGIKQDSSLYDLNRSLVIRKAQEYSLHPGKFLNQEANIYAISHLKIGLDLETQIEQLLKISNKTICKLYYYALTENPESYQKELMIMVQKNNTTLSSLNIGEFMQNKKAREILNQILSSMLILAEKINFNRFLLESLVIQNNVIKIDIIPSMLISKIIIKSMTSIKSQNQDEKIKIQEKIDDTIVVQDEFKCQKKTQETIYQTKKVQQDQRIQKIGQAQYAQNQNKRQQQAQQNKQNVEQVERIQDAVQQKVKQRKPEKRFLDIQISFKKQGNQWHRQFKKDLIQIFYFIATKGDQFKQVFLFAESKPTKYYQPNYVPKQEEKEYSDPQFLLKDFLNFVHDQQETIDTQTLLKKINKHPYLWDSKQKTLFFTDFSNYVETHIDDSKLKRFEHKARQLRIIKLPWVKQLHPSFTKDLNSHRKYDYGSVRDLIRVVRNKVSHFHQLSKEVKNVIGKTPEQFVQYFLWKFPKLLPFMYVYSMKKKWKLHSL